MTTPRLDDWSPRARHTAVVLWTGFLGAVLLVLALLLAWDHFGALAEGPDWPLLSGAFLVGWVICGLIALMALALAPPPRAVTRLPRSESTDGWL
ncbi:MAG: hypothetical protein ABF296_04120 [Oceanococcaceae bacterium]